MKKINLPSQFVSVSVTIGSQVMKYDGSISLTTFLMRAKKDADAESLRRKKIIREIQRLNFVWADMLLEAYLHTMGQKPQTENLGYEIAEIYYKYSQGNLPGFTKEVSEKIDRLFSFFDVVNYVWAKTHYDECNNGFFFRRS